MGVSVSLDLSGLNVLPGILEQLRQFPDEEVGQALRDEAEIEMTEAKQRTPVKTGALRASGTVVGPTRDGDDIVVVLAFGVVPSVSASYAVEVHENFEMFHRVGQAKFLESVVLESAPFLPARVAARLSARLQGQTVPQSSPGGEES